MDRGETPGPTLLALEIERKFLVRGDTWLAQAGPGQPMRQGYLSVGGAGSVRVRISGDRAWLNIKSVTIDVTRTEFNYEVPVDDAQCMLDELCSGGVIDKTRYEIRYAGHLWEVDVFDGDNEGLIVAEIELQSEQEAFAKPEWVAEEVSSDPRYFNAALAMHPYKSW